MPTLQLIPRKSATNLKTQQTSESLESNGSKVGAGYVMQQYLDMGNICSRVITLRLEQVGFFVHSNVGILINHHWCYSTVLLFLFKVCYDEIPSRSRSYPFSSDGAKIFMSA